MKYFLISYLFIFLDIKTKNMINISIKFFIKSLYKKLLSCPYISCRFFRVKKGKNKYYVFLNFSFSLLPLLVDGLRIEFSLYISVYKILL